MAAFNISEHICIEESVERCQEHLLRTVISPEETGYKNNEEVHKAPVCVTCDCSIIGVDSFIWISSQCLKYHENVLSSDYYYTDGINPILKEQYTVDDGLISHLLLSPRARKRHDINSYMCCSSCYSVLAEMTKLKKPPKYAISNGFAIGHLPNRFTHNISPMLNNLVAPVRAFNYFVSFTGGKEQRITGNFTFFAQDVSQNIGALQYTAAINNNPSIFLVLLGSFTPQQLDKIRTQGSYSVETFEDVYRFLHENNIHYRDLPSYEEIPLPRVEQVRLSADEEGDITSAIDVREERPCNGASDNDQICWKYWFPAVADPTATSASYQNQGDFARALFVGETPTLFYHPNKVVSHAMLSQICPLAFPFGTGDVECRRRPEVSEIECLQHYLKLSLPQFL